MCRTCDGPQRKRRKSQARHVSEKEDLLALGTTAGSIVLYSVAKGKLHSTLEESHSGGVNVVRWHPEENFLYSASEDTHIAEWDLQTGRVRCKWKADRRPVTGLCVSPNGQWLLSAGQTIKMWNLETKELFRRFQGHCTAVTTLCFTPPHPPDSGNLYFLSGATRDPLLSVWQVQSDGNNKNAVSSFALTDEPQHIDIATCDDKDQVLRMAVACKDGQLHIFQHHLNGPFKKPLSPSCSVQVSSTGAQGAAGDVPVPLPLLAAAFDTEEQDLLLAYGSRLQPVVERVALNTAERNICLVRNVQTISMDALDSDITKMTASEVSASSRVLSSGLRSHHTSVKTLSSEFGKNKVDPAAEEMTIQERLGKIGERKTTVGQGGPDMAPSLQTDNFTLLLVRGLESSDNNILNKILQIRKDVLIKKTVARLPDTAVLPLVEELTKRIQGHPYTAVLMVRWLKAVLIHHTSYLSTLQDPDSSLRLLYHMIESRMKMFHRLTRLYGKLYLLITQVAACDNTYRVTEQDQGAKMVYEEESSDEDKTSGDEGLPEEDSDNWEEDEENEEDIQETLNKEKGAQEEDPLKVDPKGNSDSDFHQNETEEE
ncbi:WD repeat-containing protein 43-like isoform X2 [Scleropages formosus]|uniref:WD repeat-containing protein 43-like isoform X2 n=1 Tax=Scleropages formosus TaxID=113540 RepID=UPI0010FAC0D7|nr:WD repeat-containing protein 43-like isoform X2 [Scleropages formosus]